MATQDRVVVGLAEEPDLLVQDFTGRHSTWAVLSPLTLKLIRYDDHWRPWAELAERVPGTRDGSWRRDDDGRTTVTYRLRAGLRWHDGTPLTARDAVAAFELLRSLRADYPHRPIVEAIEEMHVTGDDGLSLTVRWGNAKPYAPFEEWGTVLPARLLQSATLDDPGRWTREESLRCPISHGPFRIGEWVAGSHLRLVRHARHPRGMPRLSEIEFRFFRDPAELRDAVAGGRVHVTELSGFSAADAEALAGCSPRVRVANVPSSMWEHLDFNLSDRHLADLRVRQAIAHAIDREAIAAEVHRGLCQVAHSWLPPRHPAHNDQVERYPHDPRRSRELLAAAGFRPGPGGVLIDPDGRPLSFGLLTTARPGGGRWTASSSRPLVAERMARQLAAVGIELRPEAVTADKAFARFRSRDFPHLAMFAWSIGLEANGYLMWHSSQVPDGPGCYGTNLPGWRSALNDQVLEKIIAEGDPDARDKLIREQQVEWARQLPSLPLFFLPQVNAYDAGLRNVRYVGAFGTYVTWNCWQWAWDRDQDGTP
ncbi:MAG TPA: peptide ABC transporter substrate-binding protein [Trebonia sp.]|nr:peptide ABC transporter substrate-binding protein [Trebonia sp.]